MDEKDYRYDTRPKRLNPASPSFQRGKLGALLLNVPYREMHLLASARLTGVPLWTLDKRLNEVALRLGLAP